MSLSTKAIVLGAAGVATIALVGVGVGADMNASSSVSGHLTSGHVGVTVVPGGATASYDGVTFPATYSASTPTSGPGAGTAFTYAGFQTVGSDFTADIPLTIKNTGTLPISSLSLATAIAARNVVTGDQSPSLPLSAFPLAHDTVITISLGGQPIYSGSLDSVPNQKLALPAPLAPNASVDVAVHLSNPTGGYTNADSDQSITPTFTVTASDV